MTTAQILVGWRSRLSQLRTNSLQRAASTLVGGTAFGQGLAVLSLPLLTRLYSPQDFSVLAVYVAILTILLGAACLRFEIAIPIPESDEKAAALLGLAIVSATALSGLTAVVLWLAREPVVALLGHPEIGPYLSLVPLGLWLSACYQAVQYWATRRRRFPVIARTRITQSSAGVAAQLGLGWMGLAPLGLLLGHTLMSGAGAIGLGLSALRQDRNVLRSIRFSGVWPVAREYRRFPVYATLDALANNGALQFPVLIIAAYAVGPEAGFLLLASRALSTPVALVGNAVGQVFLSVAPDRLRSGDLPRLTTRTMTALVRSGTGPLVLAGLIAAPIFMLVFGKEWERAGELVAWMTPWFLLKLISSPVSMVMHVKMQQKALLVMTVFGLAMRVGAVWLAAIVAPQWMSEAYALSSSLFYLILCILVGKAAGIGRVEAVTVLKAAFCPLTWACAALGVLALAFAS